MFKIKPNKKMRIKSKKPGLATKSKTITKKSASPVKAGQFVRVSPEKSSTKSEFYKKLKQRNQEQEARKQKIDHFTKVGSIVLVHIDFIREIVLDVKLPKGSRGQIEASSLSETYKSQLKKFVDDSDEVELKPLNQLFKVGQNVYAKITARSGNNCKLSLVPRDVHGGISHTAVINGMVLTGTIQKEDENDEENYEVETGIKNLVAKLTKTKANREYMPGDIVVCSIKNVYHSSFQSTATLKDRTGEDDVKSQFKGDPKPSLILPGHTTTVVVDADKKAKIYGSIDVEILPGGGNPSSPGDEHECVVVCVTNKGEKIFVCLADQLPSIYGPAEKGDIKVGDFVEMRVETIRGNLIEGDANGRRVVAYQQDLACTSCCLKIGNRLAGKIINFYQNTYYMTNRYEYLLPGSGAVLSNIEDAEVGVRSLGTVIKDFGRFYLIRFFNNIRGTVSKAEFDNAPPIMGQIFEFQISGIKAGEAINSKKIFLKLMRPMKTDHLIGSICKAVVINHHSWGLEIRINNDDGDNDGDEERRVGYIPTALMSRIFNLSQSLHSSIKDGDEVECVDLGGKIFSLKDVKYYQENPAKDFDEIEDDDVIRGWIKSILNQNQIEVCLPIKNSPVHSVVVDFEEKLSKLSTFQTIYLKIAEKRENSMNICPKLESVWSNDFSETARYLEEYLNDQNVGLKVLKDSNRPLGRYKIGASVSGSVVNIVENPELARIKVDFGDNVFGWLNAVKKDVKVGDTLKCFVAFVDMCYQSLDLTTRKIKKFTDLPIDSLKANIISVKPNLTIAQAESNGGLIYIPNRVHSNDFKGLTRTHVKLGKTTLIALRLYKNLLIGIPESFHNSVVRKFEVKRKIDDVVEDDPAEESPKPKNKKSKKEQPETDDSLVPNISNFWNLTLKAINDHQDRNDETLHDDDDENLSPDSEVKKKLTPAERREQFKIEEARIRQIEEKLASSTSELTSSDEYDRLVMSTPNDSMLWIKYMAFHLQSTEIDRARSVAKQALKTISFREENEKINVWIALLNLEIRYGNSESFNDTLSDAARTNDPYKIYSKCLEIFSACNKTDEMNDIITKMRKKFKAMPEMWIQIAGVFFELGEKERASKLLGRALTSLPEKDHVRTITQFALLMNKHGESEMAHAHLEQILASYPKRVDIWSVYIDMLAKSNQLDLARQTLDRAIIQNLPAKKMRPLFKKYLDFEKRYGTEENVQRVKKLAEEFVARKINNE